MAQSEQKSEAPPSDWGLEYLRTFGDGSGLMLEKRSLSSTSEEIRLTVQYRPGNGLGALRPYQLMWSLTSSDTPEPPTC
jgi:hypothetical protein